MYKIREEKILSKTDLKSIVLQPFTVGGNSKELIDVESKLSLPTGSEVNSMCLFQNGFLFGLADGRIGYSYKNKENEYINLHNGNICALDISDSIIMTGSWDKSSYVLCLCDKESADLSLNQAYYRKICLPHPEAVWAVKIIDDNTFITGCADGMVRLFKNGKIFKELVKHANAVRALLLVNQRVISVDNYGKLLKTSLNSQIEKTRSLDEMCFCMCETEGLIFVGGENGHVFVINTDFEILGRVKLPCTSCWSIKADKNLVYVCGSNGTCYVLEKDDSFQSNSTVKEDTEPVQQPCEQKQPLKNQQDGDFVSEGVKYRIEAGKLYQEIDSNWKFIGDVGNSHDHTFTIELEGKNYTLSFNDNDNSHEVASNFIHKNKMSQVYHQEIVDYIEKNFKKKSKLKYYESIDLNGISKFLNNKASVIEILKKITEGLKISLYKGNDNNIYQLEDQIKDIPLFIKLDICKYLVFKKIHIDLSFIFRSEITNKKEAKAFIFLATNLVDDPPFSLSIFQLKIRKLRDLGLLTLDDVKWFENNMQILNHK